MDKREKIMEILAQKSICGEGSLSFSCPKIEFSIRPGETEEGSFTIAGREGLALSGIVVPDDIRMQCQTREFTGNPSRIFFQFCSKGLEEGEVCSGAFKIVSSQGESALPYTVTIAPRLFETSLGPMKNLFHFANLAKVNWQEAVKAFYAPDFEKVLAGNDKQYLNVYRALRIPPETEQKVEEFLMWVRKKQQVRYTCDREEITLFSQEDITREIVTLTRNGWGYTRLLVETEGAFLETEKDVLTEHDFLGNQCACGLLIFHSALHAGCNYGRVRFFNEYVSLEIPVCVNRTKRMTGKRRRNRKQKTLAFYQCYLQYGMGKISRQEWLAAIEKVVAGMDTIKREEPVKELFQAHILLTKERYSEAKRVLEHVGNRIIPEETSPKTACYYLYLTTLVSEDEHYIRAVTEEIRRVWQNGDSGWEVAWLLLYLDEECGRSLSRKWVFLEQQFEKGCRSPVWYMEAAMLIRKNPAFLMKLTPFMLQTLTFMAKYDYLTAECIGQIHYLADRMKQYSERMYAILKVCYEKKKDKESLRALCGLLIKGNKIGPVYAAWYRKGIEHELWLTRLYEYYMLSVDLQSHEKIPAAAVRYFSYRSELPYERMAYLYAYVFRKRGKYPDLYRIYLPDAEKFLTEQLEKGRMNRDIAFIFRELIQEGIVGGEMLGNYADRLFFHEIRVDMPDVSRIIVVHGKLQEETVWEVCDGCACVQLYDPDFNLVFEKASGGRFVCDIGYEDRILFYPDEMTYEILPEEAGLFQDETGVTLYQCEHGKTYTAVDGENEKYARQLWNSAGICASYKNELGTKLLQYYLAYDMADELDQFLPQLQPGQLRSRERVEALQCLVLRGMYDIAYEWVCAYGAENVKPKLIARLCSRLLTYNDFMESEDMTMLSYFSFCCGKYDDNILQYLSHHFTGTVRELWEIWRACDRFDTGSYELCERLLVQMLFTGEYVEEEGAVFRKYLEGSADESLTDRYLLHLAYRYFVHGYEPEPLLWRELKRKSRNGQQQDIICELALLRFFSGQEELEEEERQMVRLFLDDLILKKGIVFGFFRQFLPLVPEMVYFMDQTFLEYRAETENPLLLHYMLKADERNGAYHTDELRCCYAGIYTRSFLLFEGETLQYYITEKKGEKENLVESGVLHGSNGETLQAGRFGAINRFIEAVSQHESAKAEKMLEEYYQTDFSAERLFTLL